MERPPLDEWLSLFQATIAAEGTTTGAGAVTGDSFIDAALAGVGANSFVSMLAILYPGDLQNVDSKDITAFNNATGEVTLAGAYKGVAAAIPAGVPYKIVTFRFVPAEVAALLADIGDSSASTLGSLYAILGNPAQTFLAMIGYEGATSLANKLTAARAALLDEITALRMAELDAANIPADIDTLLTRLSAARAGYLDELDFDLQGTLATIAGYIDAEVAALLADVGDASTSTLGSLYAILGDPAQNFLTMIGYEGATSLANKLTAARAALLDQITALRMAELDAANIPADVDNILLDTQIRKVQSGVKVINAAVTKYLHIDSGTNGAEILSIAIEGVIGHDWTLDVYVPAADAEAATQAKSKRDTIAYLAADTEGGLLKPFGIPFDCYLDFTNDGGNDQIDQVTVTYRSRGALTLTWEA